MNQRILHITTVGSALSFVEGYAKLLQVNNLDMQVASNGDTAFDAFCKAENVKGFRCDMKREITPLEDVRTIFRLIKIIRSASPAIVHTHTPKASLLGMIAAYVVCVPVRIYHVHGLPIETARGLRKWLLWLSDAVATRLATQILSVSQSVGSQMARYKICSPKKISVLGSGSINGVELKNKFVPDMTSEEQVEARRVLGISPEAMVFGFVGRLVPDKGIRELIVAWQNILKEFQNVHLVIAGDEEAHDPLENHIRTELTSNPTIHHVGFVKNTKQIYQAIDVLVLPTYREGLPTVLLEAAAMAKPVIASAVTGCVDVVLDGKTGLLTKKGDANDLIEKIRYYIKEPEERIQHGMAGRKHVEQHYDRDQVQEVLIMEYLKLLASKEQSSV